MLEMGNQQVRTKLLPRLGATHVLELRWVLGDPWGSCPSPPHHGVGLVPLPVHHPHAVLTLVQTSCSSLSCGFPSPWLGRCKVRAVGGRLPVGLPTQETPHQGSFTQHGGRLAWGPCLLLGTSWGV